MTIRIVTESVKTIKLTVLAGQTGIKKADPVNLRVTGAVRNTAVNATVHDPDNDITVKMGDHTLIDALPDLQAFSTAPHDKHDDSPKFRQADNLALEVNVVNAPAVDVVYTASVTYWEIMYSGEDVQQ